jgi:acetoacetyl-CoA synthetase
MSTTAQERPLWTPSAEMREGSELARFMRWAGERHGRAFASYEELWRWSVEELEAFWADVWEFCGVHASKPHERVLASHEMPGTRWFEGAELNYAENLLADRDAATVAVLHASELRPLREISWGELGACVA